ncbi:MAG: Bro-N domain-containing protein [Candidatus Saccharimonadales bacterium]
MNTSEPLPSEGESKIDLFRRAEVRKTLHGNEWWFSVKDVLEAVTDTTDGNRYSRDLRAMDPGLKDSWAEITLILPFKTATRGVQDMTFINIEGVFRLIQSVPSAKVEPFKRWLAKVGYERLQEERDPGLAIKRAITIYRSKGYTDEWIDARIRNKASRELLTAEWQSRGMEEYIALLSDSISVKTFGIRINEHKRIKGLKGQSLRDNMTPIELTLTTLGEQTTREITRSVNAKSLQQHIKAAEQGGAIAGQARKNIESAIGSSVVSERNFLTPRQRQNNAGVGSLDDALKEFLGFDE